MSKVFQISYLLHSCMPSRETSKCCQIRHSSLRTREWNPPFDPIFHAFRHFVPLAFREVVHANWCFAHYHLLLAEQHSQRLNLFPWTYLSMEKHCTDRTARPGVKIRPVDNRYDLFRKDQIHGLQIAWLWNSTVLPHVNRSCVLFYSTWHFSVGKKRRILEGVRKGKFPLSPLPLPLRPFFWFARSNFRAISRSENACNRG